MIEITSKPSPTLKDPKKWSAEFQDFLKIALEKDVIKRATIDKLLDHAFIKKECSREKVAELLKVIM